MTLQLDSVYAYIDQHIDEHVQNIQRFVRQPSIFAENRGLREAAELVCRYLSDLGCAQVELLETTGGAPLVYGEYDAGAEKTLLLRLMYDTQPAGDESAWSSPPFEARLVNIEPFGRCVVGRGTANSKGPFMAFLNAARSLKEITGTLPVNLLFAVQGDEETPGGAQTYEEFIRRHGERLGLARADALYVPYPPLQDEHGNVTMYLGYRGSINVEIECSGEHWGRGPSGPVHSMAADILDSPVWRMIHALATLTSEDGKTILVDGWYDNVVEPEKEDLELIERSSERPDLPPPSERDFFSSLSSGVKAFTDEATGQDLLLRYCYSTPLIISALSTTPAIHPPAGVLPYKITARVMARLTPRQEPEELVSNLRKHFDSHGYEDIQIRLLGQRSACKTSLNSEIVRAMVKTFRDSGHEPDILPFLPSFGPTWVFHKHLGIPFTHGGLGHFARAHAPNEYYVIDGNDRVAGLAGSEKFYASLLENYARI